MGLDLNYIDGQTPISEEEKRGLRIKSISTQGELDEFEQLNIEKAIEWIMNNRFVTEQILTESFIKLVHKKMFGEVWEWAGLFRKTEKNIGISWVKIGVELKMLLDDTIYWIENETYLPDEVAIRFKHRLASIHCFPNGNGRHSRVLADIIIESIFGKEVFSWGRSNLIKSDNLRKDYINSLKEADNGLIDSLIKFSRR